MIRLECLQKITVIFFIHYLAVFVPKYRFYICDNCGKTNDNCFGSYCAYDSQGSELGLGKYKAQESLRQLCVFKSFGEDEWYSYMEEFQDKDTENMRKYTTFYHEIISMPKQLIIDNCLV